MSTRQIAFGLAAVIVFAMAGSGSLSADENVPPPTTTTVVEQFDEESGIIWSQIDETTIEVRLPD